MSFLFSVILAIGFVTIKCAHPSTIFSISACQVNNFCNEEDKSVNACVRMAVLSSFDAVFCATGADHITQLSDSET